LKPTELVIEFLRGYLKPLDKTGVEDYQKGCYSIPVDQTQISLSAYAELVAKVVQEDDSIGIAVEADALPP